MKFLTVTDVRRRSGAPTDIISDDYIESIIDQVEQDGEKFMNTKFIPTEKIEITGAESLVYIYTTQIPLLTVRELKSDDDTLDVTKLLTYTSGKIELSRNSDVSVLTSLNKEIKIRYLYGYVKETGDETKTDASVSSGTSVAISVNDSSNFSSGDWVYIVGMDGNQEYFKITSTSTGQITADEIIKPHENGSKIRKVSIPSFIKRYLEVEAAIAVAINAIGSTYTFNASYSFGDLNIQQGVPYTHWSESVQKNLKERENLYSRIKPRIKIM